MFETVLYPTDFSDVAVKALEYIKKLKASGAKEVIVLHVNDIRGNDSVLRILGESQFNKLEKSKREITETKLNGIKKELVDAGLKVAVRIESGMPVREILRVEEEENVAVIVIGSHGRSNLEEIFLGSVSEKVIRKSRAPVLVVKR
ncbi:MAG: universal stress protein [Deltaproteobacteria bacterium]|nr:universal stress protein [Deltaproteobacteria bacterium]MBW2483102.1 universal stress protein [Deltaproteobacteria bacterium]